jgi:hypothetical protein
MPNKRLDVTGQRFGRLVALEFVGPSKSSSIWRFQCDCGKIVEKLLRYVKNSGCKSCGCLYEEISGKQSMKPTGEANAYGLYLTYKDSAKNRDLCFELDFEEFRELTSYACSYCGVLPETIRDAPNTNGLYVYNGIDRVNNDVGYVFWNCRSCCKTCNYAKHTMGLGQFLSWIKRLSSYKEQRDMNLSIRCW